MKRTLSIFIVFLFVVTSLAEAQLINYNRRSKKNTQAAQQIQQPQTTTTTEQSAKYSRYTEESSVEKYVAPLVTNRLEEVYDENEDGRLQKAEVQSLYKYAIKAIERRGRMRVSSDTLKIFDTDDDGVISSYEISGLKKAVN